MSAGPFLPRTAPPSEAARGPAPTRPQAASPIFRAALVQTSASLRPFHSALAPLQGWGYPSACTCYPPPSPGGVRHVCHMPLPQQRQKQPQGGSTHEQESNNYRKAQRLPDRYRPHHRKPQSRSDSVGEALADTPLRGRPVSPKLPHGQALSRYQHHALVVLQL